MKTPINIRELGDPIHIVEEPVDPETWGRLGYFDERTGKIAIAQNQPEAGKHIVLLHEFLHLVDAQMRSAGITKRRADHRWIESAAPNLLALLVLSGLYTGLSKEELLGFMATQAGDRVDLDGVEYEVTETGADALRAPSSRPEER
jgi:hypothetical protein